MDLVYLGLLKISGLDAKKLLQGQLTCHLDEISATQSRLGAHCNPQGRIISLFRIFLHEDAYYLQMPRVLVPIALAALKKYAVFFKVEMSDASDTMRCIGYFGQSLTQWLALLPEKNNEVVVYQDVNVVYFNGHYQIIGPGASMMSLWQKLSGYATEMPDTYWHQAEIRAGIVTLFPETSEEFLPHELNLPELNAVSFNKGCYTGQEIIARMHYRGKLKKKLHFISLEQKIRPERGALIETGPHSVQIVDYCQTDNNHYELLVLGQNAT